MNIKIGREQIKNKTVAEEFNKLKITEKDGTIRELNPAETQKYIADLLFGGKTLNTLEKNLIEAGVKGNDWAKRKKIMKLLEDRFTDKIDKKGIEELREEFQAFEEEQQQQDK